MAAVDSVFDKNSKLANLLQDADKVREYISKPRRRNGGIHAELVTDDHETRWATGDLISSLCKQPLPLTEDQIVYLLQFKISEFFSGVKTGDDEKFVDPVICAERFAKDRSTKPKNKGLSKPALYIRFTYESWSCGKPDQEISQCHFTNSIFDTKR